jgi:hypothetical protein
MLVRNRQPSDCIKEYSRRRAVILVVFEQSPAKAIESFVAYQDGGLSVMQQRAPCRTSMTSPDDALHASLVIRLAGDWMSFPEWRAWGGVLNGVALLAFVLGAVSAVIRGAFTPYRRRSAMCESRSEAVDLRCCPRRKND